MIIAPSFLGRSKIPRRLGFVVTGFSIFFASDFIYRRICYESYLRFYPQFPFEVRRALESRDSRYLFMLDINDLKKNAYNQETKKYLY